MLESWQMRILLIKIQYIAVDNKPLHVLRLVHFTLNLLFSQQLESSSTYYSCTCWYDDQITCNIYGQLIGPRRWMSVDLVMAGVDTWTRHTVTHRARAEACISQ